MPVRSMRLKLVVPRQPSELDAAQALWSTHRLVNEAVAFYERMPLLLRGEAYSAGAESYSQASVREELLKHVHTAQARNGGAGGNDEQIINFCRDLYVSIVPSAAFTCS
jgi:hypothetical protein